MTTLAPSRPNRSAMAYPILQEKIARILYINYYHLNTISQIQITDKWYVITLSAQSTFV